MRRALLVVGLLAVLAPAPAGAATVELMVVGKQRVLREPAPVKLAARSVRVGGRRCAVGRATPLSVLAGTRLRVRLQDYGSCGRSPRDAGTLYVTQIGPDRRGGPAGWVYKVGRRAGTTGAGDPSGPFGTGRRLRGGQRVLWFWCVQDRGGACQRTLEVSPSSSTVAPGAPLRVTVRGYDDNGRGVPVAGAVVRLGTAEATTDASGVAEVAAPASGAARLTAGHTGMVRSWPRTVRVR
jgi:hypothetical protein